MKGVILLLAVTLHIASCFKTDCPRPCVPLEECRDLISKIKNNPIAVREATCGFQGRVPVVCCPSTTEPVTRPPVTQPPVTQPPVTQPPVTPKPTLTDSLLPKDCGHFAHGDRIHGGTKTRIGNYPWMVALGYRNSFTRQLQFLCGGSLINGRYILTAAHCLTPREPDVVRIGEWDLSTTEDCEVNLAGFRFCSPEPVQDVTPEEILLHPDYNTRTNFSDDIGLIRLSSPARLSQWVQPVCLPGEGSDLRSFLQDGRRAIVTGWGFTENHTTSDTLLQVQVPQVDQASCNTVYKGRLIEDQVCFGGVKGEDSCGGDSGGPLVVSASNSPPYTQIGIVSFGPVACGKQDVPGVYTYVASYRDWIESNLKS